MTVKLPPTGVPAWGEPGHEPWQRIVLPDPNEFERKFDNVPAPKMSPLVFLMGMIGEAVILVFPITTFPAAESSSRGRETRNRA